MTVKEIYYYFVTTFANGRRDYEGYLDETVARQTSTERAVFYAKQGSKNVVEYVGTELPEDLRWASIEQVFHMGDLTGSEAQIKWARDIRYRYGEWILERFPEDARARYERVIALSPTLKHEAAHWIKNRYSLASTTTASHYVAEGC